MIQLYLNKHVPQHSKELTGVPPAKAREFVAHYKCNPSALLHFSVADLIASPELWLVGTDEAKKRDVWLQESYPTLEKKEEENTQDSLLTCGKCKQRKVEYYQKQTRGADEPMTVFCNCTNCGKRWVQ